MHGGMQLLTTNRPQKAPASSRGCGRSKEKSVAPVHASCRRLQKDSEATIALWPMAEARRYDAGIHSVFARNEWRKSVRQTRKDLVDGHVFAALSHQRLVHAGRFDL